MTQQLTSKQLTSLGHNFLACAQAVGNFRYSKKLSGEINKKLSDIQWTLLNYSDDFYAASASVVMNDVKSSLGIIQQLTQNMNESFLRIRKIQKAIDVATAAVTLGAALFSKSPKAIDDALIKLVGEWSSG